MTSMAEKLAHIWPEIILGIGAVACMIIGLSKDATKRRSVVWIAGISIALSAVVPFLFLGHWSFVFPRLTLNFFGSEAGIPYPWIAVEDAGLGGTPLANFVKFAVAVVGLLLLLVAANVPDGLKQVRDEEDSDSFDPTYSIRGEFFAFFLFSLAGVMLCSGADELIWLFLALELTSLPTYVMIATTRDKSLAQESAVKYFFLGALSVAIFLYGFALIYGATGTTLLYSTDPGALTLQSYVAGLRATDTALPMTLVVGLAFAVVGLAFKIAAVPMHFYAADVYEGAATPVTAFLAFVPKTAGFVSLIILLGAVGWPLPEPIMWLLWVMAALTMTFGNVLGLLQTSVKRMLAYSSIAHSGYMLVGLAAGVQWSIAAKASALQSGVAGVLFYLVAYGVGNLGGFAVLASLSKQGEEAETYDDLSGLSKRRPGLAAVMLLSMISLIGLPPMIGFLGKIYLFGPAMSAASTAMVWLVVIAVINSAISAVYYLRAASSVFFGEANDQVTYQHSLPRAVGAGLAGLFALLLGIFGGGIAHNALQASRPLNATPVKQADVNASKSVDATAKTADGDVAGRS